MNSESHQKRLCKKGEQEGNPRISSQSNLFDALSKATAKKSNRDKEKRGMKREIVGQDLNG